MSTLATQQDIRFAKDAPSGHHPTMFKAVLRWVLVIVSVLLVGPLASRMLQGLRDVDGGHAVTILVNGNLGKGLVAGLAVFAAAGVVGIIGSYFLSLNTGLLSAGLVLAWGAFSEAASGGGVSRPGTLENIVRRAGGGQDLPMLAIEGFLVTVAAAALAWLMVRVAHRAQQTASGSEPSGGPDRQPALIYGSGQGSPWQALGLSMLAAIGVAAFAAWFLAASGAKGQTFAAALVAGLLAGLAAQTTASSKGYHLTPVAPMLGIALVALAGPLIARAMAGGNIVELVYAGKVFSLARPLSLDWASGAMIGVPVGLGWAGAMLDRRHLPS
jgi:hypothetical protein